MIKKYLEINYIIINYKCINLKDFKMYETKNNS